MTNHDFIILVTISGLWFGWGLFLLALVAWSLAKASRQQPPTKDDQDDHH